MKRIFVPTRDGSDWQPLLAKPKFHWKKGASAMTAAAAWEDAGSELPPEIRSLLSDARQPELGDLTLLAAFPEWQVALPGGQTTSNTDVMAFCRNDSGLCVVAVEAKVLEDFGPTVGEKRAGASEGQTVRLDYLHQILGVEHFDDSIRYQLLHRTASAILTARDFHAATAVMMVHAFETPFDRRQDFNAFCEAVRAVPVSPGVFRVQGNNRPAVYLAWCDGDKKYRSANLSSIYELT
jgi:hypothetical protein